MTDLREAAMMALEALEYENSWRLPRNEKPYVSTLEAIAALRAALAQQAEPAQDRHRACPTHCCPVHGCKYGHDDCPVAAGAVQPVYPRNNGCESCADDALAQQAEPVEPVATLGYARKIEVLIPQRDALLEALKALLNAESSYAWAGYSEEEIAARDKAFAAIEAVEDNT